MSLINRIVRHEGFVAHAYQDHLNFWTIGHGICIDKRKGCGITERESLQIVSNRLTAIRKDLYDRLGWFDIAPVGIQDVVTEMAYQMGVDGVMGFRKFLQALSEEDYQRAADEMLDSLWHKQTPGRAEELASIVRDHTSTPST